MVNIDNLLHKTEKVDPKIQGRFEKFNLKENPFPSEPFVNKLSEDNRINGKIYEMEIRKREYELVAKNFLKISQNDLRHLRIGYIIDKSYLGRGNGKSAFLVNLQDKINEEFSINLSDSLNKCFCCYLSPEAGGRTKSFDQFLDLLFSSILSLNIIDITLNSLRLENIINLYPKLNIEKEFKSYEELFKKLSSQAWYKDKDVDINTINENIQKNKYISVLPREIPFFQSNSLFSNNLITQKDFQDYYEGLKKGKEKIKFIFNDLVSIFLSAGFNGAYILVDDFERIPDFQSSRQKRDFALELRSCLFDGTYLNSKLGFYVFILALHAGVPRLINEAWGDSGMASRAPIFTNTYSKHIIPFDKLSKDLVKLLIKKYLNEYKINNKVKSDIFPFTENAISKISEISELNASLILRMCYDLLEFASENPAIKTIDEDFINSVREKIKFEDIPSRKFTKIETERLQEKSE